MKKEAHPTSLRRPACGIATSLPVKMLTFPSQVPAFTIFTPKKISRSIPPSFASFPPVNKSTQVPATTNSDHQSSIKNSRQNSSLARSGTQFIDRLPSFPSFAFVKALQREFHASQPPSSALCTPDFAFTKPAWYRGFLRRTAKPIFFSSLLLRHFVSPPNPEFLFPLRTIRSRSSFFSPL